MIDYLVDMIEDVLDRVPQQHCWGEIDVTLLMGDVGKGKIALPELPEVIREKCSSIRKIREINDLRCSQAGVVAQLLFDSKNQVICLFQAAYDQWNDAFYEAYEKAKTKGGKEAEEEQDKSVLTFKITAATALTSALRSASSAARETSIAE